MTVPTEVSEEDFTGDGVVTAFPIPFGIQADENLVVTLLLDGETVPTAQVLGTHYSVDGAGGATCTVNMDTAPPADSTLHVERTVPIVQDTALRQAGPYTARTHERALDYRTYVDQQQQREIDALTTLGSLVPVSDYSAVLLEHTFTTDADDVEATFPMLLVLPAGLIPTGLVVAKVVNNTDPAALLKEAVFAHWTANGSFISLPPIYTITFRYITGLEPGTEYTITLEILTEPVS